MRLLSRSLCGLSLVHVRRRSRLHDRLLRGRQWLRPAAPPLYQPVRNVLQQLPRLCHVLACHVSLSEEVELGLQLTRAFQLHPL